mmetsp:Transcript_4589/g.11823  ORF Transcript_4589/g.11823 Transcript_4589/m.11823 type:complete len:188 (+) Transcript_4589:55-618(+)
MFLTLRLVTSLAAAATALAPRGDVGLRTTRAEVLAALGGMVPVAAAAVSGGGKDYAGLTIKGEDFANGQYAGKDFSGVDAAGTNFKNSQLRGARFFKADLAGADLSGCDLTAASFEGANLDGTVLTNAVAEGTAFSQTLEGVGDVRGVDFTDAVIRSDINKKLCARPDAAGTNPKTGVETRDSLFCQ